MMKNKKKEYIKFATVKRKSQRRRHRIESREVSFRVWILDSSSSSSSICLDFLQMNSFDIVQVFRNYSDLRKAIQSRCAFSFGNEDSGHVETPVVTLKHKLEVLLIHVQSSLQTWNSIISELSYLTSNLNLMVDFSEFSLFYDFVFFVCREKGQKTIVTAVSRAVRAWRTYLVGRFRLVNQWCDFVENNHHHNISEDTWRQVLAFSRCVHENLEGYDPEGAWPVLIDDFVEHMYRVSGSNKTCNCGASVSQSGVFEDSLPGLKILPGLKRKLPEDMELDGNDPSSSSSGSMEASPVGSVKRSRCMACKPLNRDMGCSKSTCTVGCLSKGFAGLFSDAFVLGIGSRKKSIIHVSFGDSV